MSDRRLSVDGFEINDGGDCYVIAELGHNHQGDLEQAKQMIHAAAECGCNAVKFQKRSNRTLYTREFYEQPYDNEFSFGRTYGEHRRGARARARRVPRAAGVRARPGHRALRHGVRLRERGLPRGARRACVQARVRRPEEHATPAPRRLAREAGLPVDRRRHAGGRRARRRDDRADQPAAVRPPVHGRVPGGRGGSQPERDRDAARAVPRARDRPLRPPERDRDGARRLHARRARRSRSTSRSTTR